MKICTTSFQSLFDISNYATCICSRLSRYPRVSILTPHTFYIFWIFCTFTDDCLDSNFIHFRQTNINLVSFNQSIWITSVSKLSHDQFNPCPFTCKFLMCQVLVKILILKHYFYFPKIPNYHYCRSLTITLDKCFLEYLRYFLKDHGRVL